MTGIERTTRQRILLPARELLAARGIRRVSMDDVAEAAGVTRVTVYRYFGDRESLVRAAFLHLAESLEALVPDLGPGPPPPRIEAAGDGDPVLGGRHRVPGLLRPAGPGPLPGRGIPDHRRRAPERHARRRPGPGLSAGAPSPPAPAGEAPSSSPPPQ